MTRGPEVTSKQQKMIGTTEIVVKHLPMVQRNGDVCYRVKLACGHVYESTRPIIRGTVLCTHSECKP
jgi:hypothetical protein